MLLKVYYFSIKSSLKKYVKKRGAWVAQSLKCLTSAQVMISRFMSSSPASGSVLTAWSLHRILYLPLSLPLPDSRAHSLFLSLK